MLKIGATMGTVVIPFMKLESDEDFDALAFFSRLVEVFESRMPRRILDGDRPQLFGDHAGESFVQRHADSANALAAQSDRRGQQQVRPVLLQQIHRANVRPQTQLNCSDQLVERLLRVPRTGERFSQLFGGEWDDVRVRMTGKGSRHGGAFLMSKPRLNVGTNLACEATAVPRHLRRLPPQNPRKRPSMTSCRCAACDRIRRPLPHSLAREARWPCGC